MFKRLPIPIWYILAAGIVLGIVLSFKSFIPYLYWDELEKFEWHRVTLPHILNYLFWPLLVPIVYWVFENFRIAKGASINHRLINVGMSLLIPLIHEAVTTVIYFIILEYLDKYTFTEETWSLVKGAFPSVYIGRIVEYWIVYGLFAAFDYYRKYKNKQAEIGRMEAQLNRTKLAVLKMQLQPHFLFNALNSISSLMDVDVQKAQEVTARLGDLLRGILERDDRIFVRVEEELHYVKTYLEIEKVRFEDRLQVDINVDDQLLHTKVPMLLIQPLVENAIKHGIAPISKPCKIKVSVTSDGDMMQISVSDDGAGQPASSDMIFSQGVGLSNVRNRLEELFPNNHTVQIHTSHNEGFEIVIRLPKTPYHEKH
ncbi:MAG: histidine kinase [Salibacteraceae bacterium]